MVRRGTCFAALFYRICVALAVNEQVATARCGVPASRYNRSSLTICWSGHLKNHYEGGLAAESGGQISPERQYRPLAVGSQVGEKRRGDSPILFSFYST